MRKRASQARAESEPPQRPREESEVNLRLRPQPRPPTEWKPRTLSETHSLSIIFVGLIFSSFILFGAGGKQAEIMLDPPREPTSFCPEFKPESEQRTLEVDLVGFFVSLIVFRGGGGD